MQLPCVYTWYKNSSFYIAGPVLTLSSNSSKDLHGEYVCRVKCNFRGTLCYEVVAERIQVKEENNKEQITTEMHAQQNASTSIEGSLLLFTSEKLLNKAYHF